MSAKEKPEKAEKPEKLTAKQKRRAEMRGVGGLAGCAMEHSKYCDLGDYFDLQIPILNLAASGSLRKGMYKKSVLMIAAPPKHFKTSFMAQIMYAFQQAYEDAYIPFYDCEGGSSKDRYKGKGIDTTNVLEHIPFATIDSLRNSMVQKMELHDPDEDSTLFCVDSLGAATTGKQLEDARKGENKVDMQRAKTIRDFCRTVGRMAFLKRLPMCIVNHTYQSQSFIPEEIPVGGSGASYECDNVWMITKAQEKDSKKETIGYTFTVGIKFSRYVKEKSKFPVIVTYDDGVHYWSGLPELGIELDFITSVLGSKGKFKFRKDTSEDVFSMDELLDGANGKMQTFLLDDEEFHLATEKKYQLV